MLPLLAPNQPRLQPPGPWVTPMLPAIATGRLLPTTLFSRAAAQQPRLAHLRFGALHAYLLSEPALIRDVVAGRAAELRKGKGLQRSKMLLGEGLLTSEGETWRRHRRLVQPAFHRDRVRAYGRAMVEAAVAHERTWSDGRRLDLAADMSALTLEIAGRTLFGADLADKARDVKAAVDEMMSRSRTFLLPGGELLDHVPLPSTRRVMAAMARLDAVVLGLVREARDRPPSEDLLSLLLDVRDDEGHGLTDREVRDEVMTLMLAGHETTANALAWTWLLLGHHPLQAQWVREELRDVLGGRAATPDDFADLPRTRAVVAESLRLFPPAWLFSRETLADMEIDGYGVPRGSLLLVCPWALHRDPRFWQQPTAFAPARWLDAGGRFDLAAPGQPRDAYLPFGIGQRLCIGEPFAWMEAVLVLATLAGRWGVAVPPQDAVRPAPLITLRPRGGLPAVLHAIPTRRQLAGLV